MDPVRKGFRLYDRPMSPRRLSPPVYDQLKHKHSIRLFQIHPGLPIRLTLQQSDLKTKPTYQAFSYTWADADDVEMIHVNGEQFTVRRNLYTFLEQLYLQGDTSTFWCDAICINQEVTLERNHQVGFMGDIYRNAQKVLVWLIPDQIFADDMLSTGQQAGSWPDDKKIHCLKLTECDYHFFFCHLAAFLRTAHWKRTWIVQEFLLAREVDILCGKSRAPFVIYQNLISLACSQLRAIGGRQHRCQDSRDCPPRSVETANDPDYLLQAIDMERELLNSLMFKLIDDRVSRPIRKVHGGQSLEDLIDSYRQTDCQNPLDRVFAFLGLANDVDMIQVDYSQDPEELWELLEDIYHFQGQSVFGQNLWLALGMTKADMGTLRNDHPYDPSSNPGWREDMLDQGVGWLTGSAI